MNVAGAILIIDAKVGSEGYRTITELRGRSIEFTLISPAKCGCKEKMLTT